MNMLEMLFETQRAFDKKFNNNKNKNIYKPTSDLGYQPPPVLSHFIFMYFRLIQELKWYNSN